MEDFTLCLNLLGTNTYSEIPAECFSEGQPMKCTPFGIRAHMGLGLPPSVPVSYKNNDMMLFLVGNVYNLDSLWNSYVKRRVSEEPIVYPSKLVLLLKLYCVYGIDYLLQLLDGEFSMVLVDQRVEQSETKMYVVRDAMGTQPLYVSSGKGGELFLISTTPCLHSGELVPPGTFYKYSLPHKVQTKWSYTSSHVHYMLGRSGNVCLEVGGLMNYLEYAVEKRMFCPSATIAPDEPNPKSKPTILCIGRRGGGDGEYSETWVDPEYSLLCSVLDRVCKKHGWTLICRDNTDLALETLDVHTTKVFMSSFVVQTEMNIIRAISDQNPKSGSPRPLNHYTHPSIQYDYEFRNRLKRIGSDMLVPWENRFKTYGFKVEFPLLDTFWIEYYLSLKPKYRFENTIQKLLTETSFDSNV